jgi:hypothetical protein
MPLMLMFALLAGTAADQDGDGLADGLEQQLLEQFQPRFYLAAKECDMRPAEFTPNSKKPIPLARNGVIYGQAFPVGEAIELHFYHLWSRDCGRAGHALDAEHVSAWLVREGDEWRARYWYAAAHEDTGCDRGSAVHADPIHAAWRGPEVWISRGKHASFLSETICRLGCGADRCERPERLFPPRIINLGELNAPLNGAVWIQAKSWPLAVKFRSDFSPELQSRLDDSPGVQIVTRPNYVAQPMALAGSKTLDSLGVANRHTEGSLKRAHRATRKWLRERLAKPPVAVSGNTSADPAAGPQESPNQSSSENLF